MDLNSVIFLVCTLVVPCVAWPPPSVLHEALAAAEWDSLHLVCDVESGECPAAEDVLSVSPAVYVSTHLQNRSYITQMLERFSALKQLNWLVVCSQCETFLDEIHQFEQTHELPGYLTYQYQWMLVPSVNDSLTAVEDSLGTIRNLVLFNEDDEMYTARFGADRRYFQKINTQHRLQKTTLFPNLLTGLNAITLTVVTLPWYPYIIKSSSGSYSGYCIEILEIMAKHINFTIRFTAPRDGKYGALVDGEWNGMIRELVDKRADVAGILTQSYERGRVVEQLQTPVLAGQEAILYHKPEPIAMSLELLLKPFSPIVWLGFLVSMTATIITFYSTENARTNQTSDKGKGYTSYTYGYILRTTLNQGAPLSISRWSSRITYFFYNIGWIILNATYTAFLVSILSVKKDIIPFTTVVELSKNTDYKVGALGGGILLDTMLRFNFSESNPYYHLRAKILRDSLKDESVLHKDLAFHYDRLGTDRYAFLATTFEFNNLAAKSCSIDLLEEKGRRVFDGFILQKNSAYTADFDRALRNVYEEIIHHHLIKKYIPQPKQCESSRKNVAMEDIYSMFYLLCGGMGVALGVLLLEMCYKNILGRGMFDFVFL